MIAVGEPDAIGIRPLLDGGQVTPITIEPFVAGQFAVCEQRAYRSAHPDLQAALEAAISLHEARKAGKVHAGGRMTLAGDPLSHADNTPKLRATKRPAWQDFEKQVIELARLRGWMVAHFRPAETAKGWRTPISGDPGFVDLVLAKDGQIFCWELKTGTGRLSAEQRAWGAALGSTYDVMRPEDWPTIVRLLGGTEEGEE